MDSKTYLYCTIQQIHGRRGFSRHEATSLQFHNYGAESMVVETFFYLLDVGTSNALVLYNEHLRMRSERDPVPKWNIVQFKMQLVVDLVGRSITDLFDTSCEHVQEHVAVQIEGGGRSRCAFCSLMSRVCRTRYQCSVCGVPLCAMGSGKVKNDCFSQAHETEDRRQMVCTKYHEMQKKNSRQK